MSWEKPLTVMNGKVWFERRRTEGKYEVSSLLDCESENAEPFKVWLQKVDYEPDFEVPKRETGFFVNTYVSTLERGLKLKARRDPAGDVPRLFREFCTRLVDPPAGQETGYIVSTGDLRVRLTHEPLDQGEPLHIFINDRRYGEPEENFVRFAHFAEPFTLIPDHGKYDLTAIPSAENFADILRQDGWPLDRE